MKKTILTIVITALITSCLTISAEHSIHQLNDIEYANYLTLPYKTKLIKAYFRYFIYTERFLDEIESEYDIWSGSDDCERYFEAYKSLNDLVHLEDDCGCIEYNDSIDELNMGLR